MPRILRLSLTGYRNLRDVTLEIPPEGMALIGRNAQGKSNLLEAVYYLETLRSFRNARDEQLIRFGAEHFRIAADLAGEEGATTPRIPQQGGNPGVSVAAAYRASTKEKRISVDGEVVPRLGDAIGRVGAVLFAPDDLRLVSGPPAERRRFLDILLSLNARGYLELLQRFRQALHRRNATLRRGGSSAEVSAWDEILLKSGAEVTVARALWVHDHAITFHDHAREISGNETMKMRYDASIPGLGAKKASARGSQEDGTDSSESPTWGIGADKVASLYRDAIERVREQERRLRTTLVGPHRDDLSLLFLGSEGERELREFGSGGQRRTAALALRLLEAATIKRRRGREPILLLDDIFAELDEDRSRRILRLLDGFVAGQVLLTAPKESDIRFREATLPRWSIDEGEIRKS